MVCVLAQEPTPFDDNILGACARCRELVQWRPNSPKRPPRLCIDCARAVLAGTGAEAVTTLEALRDLAGGEPPTR